MDFKTKLNTMNTAREMIIMINKGKVDFIKDDFNNVINNKKHEQVTDYLVKLLNEKLDYYKAKGYNFNGKQYYLPKSIFVKKGKNLKEILEKYSYQELS